MYWRKETTQTMKTKYIIDIKEKGASADSIISELFGTKRFIRTYRSNYEYVETCFTRPDAKTYCTFKAADNAAKKIVELYDHYIGYEIIEVKRKK